MIFITTWLYRFLLAGAGLGVKRDFIIDMGRFVILLYKTVSFVIGQIVATLPEEMLMAARRQPSICNNIICVKIIKYEPYISNVCN